MLNISFNSKSLKDLNKNKIRKQIIISKNNFIYVVQNEHNTILVLYYTTNI